MRFENGDPVTAVEFNQTFNSLEGTYVGSGWQVTVGESGSAIELEVDAGSGYIDGAPIETSATTVTLSNGDTDYPRRDLVYVAADASIQVLEGNPRPFSEDTTGDTLGFEEAPVPEPDDGSELNGIPIYYVGVPAGAEDTSRVLDAYLEDIRTNVGIGASSDILDERYLSIGPRSIASGDRSPEPVPVSNGDTIIIKEWGVAVIDANGYSSPPDGVSIELLDNDFTVIEREETGMTRNNDGIVEVRVDNLGTDPFYMMNVRNWSGTDYLDIRGNGQLHGFARIEVIYG